MFKKVLLAVSILIASPSFVSAQDIFWSLSPTELVTTKFFEGGSGSAYIFVDPLFRFNGLDLDFSTSDSGLITFTGGEAFNPQLTFGFETKFDSAALTINLDNSGNLFLVTLRNQFGGPVFSSLFPIVDPCFVPEVGANLLARVDFEVTGFGSADLDFSLGTQGALVLPNVVLDPSFGSATLQSGLLGDVNQDLVVDFFDIPAFISVLANQTYQGEADANRDGVVNFIDIIGFIGLLGLQ